MMGENWTKEDYHDATYTSPVDIDMDKAQLQALGKAIPKTTLAVSDGSSTDYYKFPVGYDDLIDLIEFKNMNFAIGNIFKACFRLGEKAGTDRAYDLRKIIFFAERELKRISTNE